MITRLVLFCWCLMLTTAGISQHGNNTLSADSCWGPSTSQIDGDRAKGYAKSGWMLGGYVNYDISPMVMLQSEMLYYSLGGKGTGQMRQVAGRSNQVDVTVGSLSLPMLLKLRLGKEGLGGHSHFLIGPALGVNLYGEDATGNNPEISTLSRYDMRLILGGEVGVGDYDCAKPELHLFTPPCAGYPPGN